MDSRIEIRHLRYFVAVAEELHFGRAAMRLHLAQPALSQQIRRLEQLMDVTLFERTSRRVEMTQAGRVFETRAREILRRLDADVEEAMRVGRGESGRLTVAFVSSAAGFVSSSISTLVHGRPGVAIELVEGFTDRVLEHLRQGTADVGIVRDSEDCEDVSLQPIVKEPFVAVVPEKHDLASKEFVAAAQLLSSPLILFPRTAGSLAYARNLQPFTEIGSEPDIALRGAHWSTILQLVGAGLGVTVAPRSVATVVPRGVVAIPLASTNAKSTLQLACRSGDTNPLVDAFRRVAVDGVDGTS